MSDSNSMETTKLHDLYSDHHGWLRGWLYKKLGCSERAADLTQDTFVRLISSRRSVDQMGHEPRALLTHIAKNLVIDFWRRQDVERAYLASIAHLPEQEAPSSEEKLLILETIYRIEALPRQLPEQTRTIFLLAQLDGLKYQQIADQFEISLATVKRHMRTAFLACLTLDLE